MVDRGLATLTMSIPARVERMPASPIKEVHKMSVAQLEKEMTAVGLVPVRRTETLSLQLILVFGRK